MGIGVWGMGSRKWNCSLPCLAIQTPLMAHDVDTMAAGDASELSFVAALATLKLHRM